LNAAIQDNQRLRARGSRGPATTSGGEDVERRRQRLRIVRTLLREQHEKIRQASEALRSKFEQCEQLLAQREELLAAKAAINETRRRLERLQTKAAKHKAIAAVFYVVLTLGAVGAFSWAIAGQVAPATFV